MGPNKAELRRIFVRASGSVVEHATLPFDSAFDAVIECEAGTALHGSGARYAVRIDVIDLSAMRSVVESAIVASGSLGDAKWPSPAHQFVFGIAAPGPTSEGHIWKAFASLKVGVRRPDISFAESTIFVISSP
jgi:hypothetical protein